MKGFRFSFQAISLVALVTLAFGGLAWAQMGDMREMMQSMMGDVLPPGIDPKLLPEPKSRGAHLLERYCNQCHRLPGPGMHTAAEWPAVVERMNARMRMMHNMMGGGMMNVSAPDEPELKALIGYLQKHAQKSIVAASYPDLGTAAGRAFRETCAQCHALPEPRQHTRAEWPGVVARMQKNMAVMHKPVPDADATRAILGFLQKHARPER